MHSAEIMAGFSRGEHIRKHADYQQVYERGTKVHGRYLTLFALSNTLPIGRLGIAATRKLGGAVDRNRLLDASLTALETEFRHTLERSLRRSR